MRRFAIVAAIVTATFVAADVSLAAPSTSTSFGLDGQAISGGGGPSSSTSFNAASCIVAPGSAPGLSTSTSFRVQAGCAPALVPAICGDMIVQGGEDCDVGADVPGDCCSPTCTFESNSTVCRASTAACDAEETCTGSSEICPADELEPSGTTCTGDSNPCTRDECDGANLACMSTPDAMLPGCEPGADDPSIEPGSGTVSGSSNPGCTGGMITVFNCGPDRICFNGDDVPLGMTTKNPDGSFDVDVPDLQPGQRIYISDSCTNPPLLSGIIFVTVASQAPALSWVGLCLAIMLMAAAGGIAIQRRRYS